MSAELQGKELKTDCIPFILFSSLFDDMLGKNTVKLFQTLITGRHSCRCFFMFYVLFFGAVVNSGSPNQLRLTGQGMGAEGGRQNRLVTWLKATFPATPRACTSQHQRGVINVPAEAALRL